MQHQQEILIQCQQCTDKLYEDHCMVKQDMKNDRKKKFT